MLTFVYITCMVGVALIVAAVGLVAGVYLHEKWRHRQNNEAYKTLYDDEVRENERLRQMLKQQTELVNELRRSGKRTSNQYGEIAP